MERHTPCWRVPPCARPCMAHAHPAVGLPGHLMGAQIAAPCGGGHLDLREGPYNQHCRWHIGLAAEATAWHAWDPGARKAVALVGEGACNGRGHAGRALGKEGEEIIVF